MTDLGRDCGCVGGERVLESAGEAGGEDATLFLATSFCTFFGGLRSGEDEEFEFLELIK